MGTETTLRAKKMNEMEGGNWTNGLKEGIR